MIEYLIRCDLEDLEIEINKGEDIGKHFIVSISISISIEKLEILKKGFTRYFPKFSW